MPEVHARYSIKQLTGLDEFRALVDLQRTFGEIEPKYILPARNFAAVVDKGGATLGLFDESNSLRGFISHFPGRYQDEVVGWSFRLVIDPALRGKGLEKTLKLKQKEIALKKGLNKLYWTVDPLHLSSSFRSLRLEGTSSNTYLHNFYERATMISRHILEPDCLLVKWKLRHNQTNPVGDKDKEGYKPAFIYRDNNILNEPPRLSRNTDKPLVHVTIPGAAVLLRELGESALKQWRALSKEAFIYYFDNGYVVRSMMINDEKNPLEATFFLEREK